MPSEIFDMTRRKNEAVDEAYKVLRTNIQFYEQQNQIKVITVTSYGKGEGKSTIAKNLAISMAKSGKKVLLVDADLRKPGMFKTSEETDLKGLSDYVLGNVSMEDIINKTAVEGLYFISSGTKPPNPAELIGLPKFNELLNSAKEQFDMAIFDTPPLGSVIDCAIIAAQTDGVIIVVEQGAVKYGNVMLVKDQLEKVNARILGTVLNKVSKSDYKKYYKYYDYYKNKKALRRAGKELKMKASQR